MKARKLFSIVLLIVMLGLLLGLTPPLPNALVQNDLRSNWIAGYPLARGENIYSVPRVMDIQQNVVGTTDSYAHITISPPWVALLLIPYTLVSFVRASWLWMLTNSALIAISSILLWQDAARTRKTQARWGIGLLATFSFSITLTALAVGQTPPLVLAMVALFLLCEARGWDYGPEWPGPEWRSSRRWYLLQCC